MFDFKSKVALVTGGISGIGLSIVNELLENETKAIVLVDINESLGVRVVIDLKKKFRNNEIVFVKADVRDKDNLEDAFKFAVNTFKHLDIVINAAGVFKDKKIEEEIDINLKGTVYSCLLALDEYLPKYKSGDEAVICNVASIAGLGTFTFNCSPIYTSTKWAVLGLTRSLGTDQHFQRTKVKVVAVCPGFTETPLLKMNEDCFLGPVYEELYASFLNKAIVQPAICVGKASSYIMSEGKNGSAWVVTDKQPPYEVTW